MVERGEDAVQHMVDAVILAAALYAQHVARFRDNAYGAPVAPVVEADGALLTVGEILAHGAAMHTGAGLEYGVCESLGLALGHGEDVESKALRALAPDAGQCGKTVYEIFKCRWKNGCHVQFKLLVSFCESILWPRRGPPF